MPSYSQLHSDPYTFSLRGGRAINAHAMVPAIAGRGINQAWEARFSGPVRAAPGGDSPSVTRQLEALLARYFAHGCCCAA